MPGGMDFLLRLILAVLEISLSMDNAIVNARILERMSSAWQKAFLTLGVLIAVVLNAFDFSTLDCWSVRAIRN